MRQMPDFVCVALQINLTELDESNLLNADVFHRVKREALVLVPP